MYGPLPFSLYMSNRHNPFFLSRFQQAEDNRSVQLILLTNFNIVKQRGRQNAQIQLKPSHLKPEGFLVDIISVPNLLKVFVYF